MLFAIYCQDNPGSEQLRASLMSAHKAYVATIRERIAFAGPLFDTATSLVVGSLIVAEFTNLVALKAWLAEEPFTRGGVYMSTDIRQFSNRWPQRVGFPAA